MIQPKDYATTNVGGYEIVKPGGHKGMIRKVEEMVSKNGNNMLRIFFDLDATDVQPNYFTKQYNSDKQSKGADAKWKGVYYIVTTGQYGTANLKRFITAVEHSNPGFRVQWDTQLGDGRFVNCFMNKKIGIVFGQEEYEKPDGKIGRSVKPLRVCDFNKALEVEVPPLKKLKPKNDGYSEPMMDANGFMSVDTSLDDPTLPFN